jgi:hypothetical protein
VLGSFWFLVFSIGPTSLTDLPAHESPSGLSGVRPEGEKVWEDSPGASHSPGSEKGSEAEFHPYPFYSPRFWHGMRPLTWARLLRKGGFRIHVRRIPHVLGTTLATPVNTALALVQRAVFGRQLATAELHGPPVFIVGHWRSGTTLLHELMVRDERLSSPSTFQCFAPHHFLISEWAFCRFGSWLLPEKRPMDNMVAGWERPQEDEFALLNMGLPSPYRRMAFPNQGPVDMEYLDFQGVSRAQVDQWLAGLRKFLLAVSIATGRPLVIKSPTHTGRVGELAKAFPEARFIHVTRDPRDLFPSTCRLWRSLDRIQALQVPPEEGYEEYVVECLKRMYTAFERDRQTIGPHRLVDVRYEDLKTDPVRCLRNIYETLHLSDFETVRPAIEQWATTEHQAYQTNRHELRPEHEQLIRGAWQDYFQRYGYE